MLKKLLFKVIFLVLPLLSNAQTDKQYELVVDATCDCVSKKDFTKLDKNAMSVEFGMCMFAALDVLSEKDRKYFDFTNPAKAGELGKNIGLKMVYKCPEIMLSIGRLSESETPTNQLSESQPPMPIAGQIVEGKIKDVIEGDYVTILLIDKSGRQHKLIWSSRFSGESDFIANPQGLKNKNVEISYYLSEHYVSKMHDYFSFKNINGLTIK